MNRRLRSKCEQSALVDVFMQLLLVRDSFFVPTPRVQLLRNHNIGSSADFCAAGHADCSIAAGQALAAAKSCMADGSEHLLVLSQWCTDHSDRSTAII